MKELEGKELVAAKRAMEIIKAYNNPKNRLFTGADIQLAELLLDKLNIYIQHNCILRKIGEDIYTLDKDTLKLRARCQLPEDNDFVIKPFKHGFIITNNKTGGKWFMDKEGTIIG